ncbi:MAG: Hsp70 family protein [Firmicutes bacterium]|nr:Hsp70 family protein [Bacillota bacterium]
MEKSGSQKLHIGIDFGTTNISITGLIIDEVLKKRFPVRYGEEGVPFPSILSIGRDDSGALKVKFGRKVKSHIAEFEEKGEVIIKSLKTSTADEEREFQIFGKAFKPDAIIGGLMKAIKKFIKEYREHPVEITEATIAVPVDFSLYQRKMLIGAFRKTGIKVNKIISESTAAYISNRKKVESLSNVMVFDWGGGTLDISLLNIDKSLGRINELATAGWAVAGDRIDELIAEYLHQKMVTSGEYSEIQVSYKELSPKDRIKILTEAEKVKINFSEEDNIDESQKVFMLDYCGEKRVRCDIDYETFCELIKAVVGDATGLIKTVLDKAEMSIKMLGAIIMVGGSTNLLPLREYLEEELAFRHQIKIVYPEKVQWSVSEGAAIIDTLDCGYTLNQDISLVMSDGTPYPILKKGMQIPIEPHTVSFGTIDDAESASFIFCDDKNNLLLRSSMNSKGYDGESYYVTARVDNDLVAQITLDSRYRMAMTEPKNLEIRGLNFYYDISQIDKCDYTEELD